MMRSIADSRWKSRMHIQWYSRYIVVVEHKNWVDIHSNIGLGLWN